jgi:hypothetical protein
MEVVQVALFGAVIGVSCNLFSGVWADVCEFCVWFNVRPAAVLTMGAIGGAVVISAEFWLLIAMLSAGS